MIADVDIDAIRKQFPILERQINGNPLVYLDNASTAQKPLHVLNGIREYYASHNSNVHRGVHTLSQEASELYEKTRGETANWFGVSSSEIVFTSGTTESINMVAFGWLKNILQPGDEILLTLMEHHSNIVPWQMLAEEKEALIRVIPLNEKGELDMQEAENLMCAKTRLLAVTQVSNTLGSINDTRALCALAAAKNIPVLVDGAQSAPHMQVNLKDMGCSFFACSGHKMYAGTGIGVLYVNTVFAPQMKPFKGGGGMIKQVSFQGTTYADFPLLMEAGTPHIEGVISLRYALEFLRQTGIEAIQRHEEKLCGYFLSLLKESDDIHLIGTSEHRAAVVSLHAPGIHPFDLGTLMDQQGIAVRTGHHCTQPLMAHYGIPGTVRVSFGVYNTLQEVESCIRVLRKSLNMLR
jgi:cysteine desulfurase/selenocysteine lyase